MSTVVHIGLVAGALYLQQVKPADTARPARIMPPRLVSLVFLPEAPVTMPELTAPTPLQPAKLEVRAPEPMPALPRPLPPRTFENRRAEIAPAPEALPVEAPPKPAPPKPAPPTVQVGAFANNAVVRTTQPNREVERVAFDNPSERAIDPKPAAATTTLGGFDRPPDTRSNSQRPVDTVVAETGFGRAPAAAQPAPAGQVVRDTGFGNTTSRERPRPQEPAAATVTPSGFDNVRAVQSAAKAEAPPPPRVMVEVLSKPTPTYTDEARKLKIEGEVTLEVEFASTGALRVIRVVRGLGHGLDEAAVSAAKQIRFKPAQDGGGRSVDFRTTVHIVFRLA